MGMNFALTMQRLHRERGASGQALGVVEDQVGGPTSTHTLAAACWRVITAQVQEPVLHWCDAGAASWFDVAVAVGELAQELGLLQQPAPVNPLTTAEYPLPAWHPPPGARPCASYWGPWHELNRETAGPPLGC